MGKNDSSLEEKDRIRPLRLAISFSAREALKLLKRFSVFLKEGI